MNRCIRNWALPLLAVSLGIPAVAQNSGEATYKAKCTMCHGVDGQANTQVGKMLNVPSYKSPALMKASDAELFAAIKNGKNNKMPEFGTKLSDAQIKDVIAYIRTTLQKK